MSDGSFTFLLVRILSGGVYALNNICFEGREQNICRYYVDDIVWSGESEKSKRAGVRNISGTDEIYYDKEDG